MSFASAKDKVQVVVHIRRNIAPTPFNFNSIPKSLKF